MLTRHKHVYILRFFQGVLDRNFSFWITYLSHSTLFFKMLKYTEQSFWWFYFRGSSPHFYNTDALRGKKSNWKVTAETWTSHHWGSIWLGKISGGTCGTYLPLTKQRQQTRFWTHTLHWSCSNRKQPAGEMPLLELMQCYKRAYWNIGVKSSSNPGLFPSISFRKE